MTFWTAPRYSGATEGAVEGVESRRTCAAGIPREVLQRSARLEA